MNEKSIFERALDMDDEVKWWMKQTKQELISEFVEDLILFDEDIWDEVGFEVSKKLLLLKMKWEAKAK